jgi:F-type H+-transporting ATPase subunit gamma
VPAGLERALRRRIRSVESTQKVTRAMELIAGSRIARAQQAILSAKPYTERLAEVVSELAADPEAAGHWAFGGKEGRRAGEGATVVVVLGADRGLAGPFSLFVNRTADELLAELTRGGEAPVLVAVGRKTLSHFRQRGQRLAAHFEGMSDRPKFADARRVVARVTELLGGAGTVYAVSTRFISAGSQRVEKRRLVPVERRRREAATVFEFEPGPEKIMDTLLPRWLEAEVYLALLESAASFHVSQQRAMAAATDNAEELIKTLRRQMNRARQDAITTEIMEIVGGAEALRKAAGVEAPPRPDVYLFPEAS